MTRLSPHANPSLPAAERSRRPTIATWLFIGALGATMVALLTFMLVIERFVRDESRLQATQFLQTNADALRDALDRGMAQHVEAVAIMSQLDQVAAGSDPVAIRRALDTMRASFPQFAWLGFADMGGQVVASTDGLLQGASVAARPWFAGAQRGLHVGDVHAALLLAKLLPAQPEPWRFVDVAAPVRGPDGRVRAILGAHLSWGWAAQVKRELVDRTLQRHQAEALVVSADGTVLLGSPALQGAKLAAAPGLMVVHSHTQGAGRFPGLGWDVVLRQPEGVALAAYDALKQRIQAAAAVLCLLLTPLLWLLARRLAMPLDDLVARLDGRGPVRGRLLYREADLLGRALDRHEQRQHDDAARLRELNASLEARVNERTAALAQANAELTQAERERRQGEQRLRTITDNVPVLISYVDHEERLRFCNGTHEEWLGMAPQRIVGRTLREKLGPQYETREPYVRRALAGERIEFDYASDALGKRRQLHTTYLPDRGEDGAVAGFYVLVTDVTAMKAAEAQLALQARTDSLTGLPNRHAFDERLAAALARSRRSAKPIGLLFLDVDRFKAINDTLGHAGGDEVLKEFARRVARSVRETDTVARLAGDEFVVVLEGLNKPEEADLVARKVLAAIHRPFDVGGTALDVTTSIGIAFQPDGRAAPAELLARADEALYEAKAHGRNTFRMRAA